MEDCHYYLRSLCAKGSLCRFRHSEVAKKSNVLCPKWQAPTGCSDGDCPLIHSSTLPESPENIECVFEKKGGCKKAGCPFKHTKTENGTGSPVSLMSTPLTQTSNLLESTTPVSAIRKPSPQEEESLRKVQVPLRPVDGQRTVRLVTKRPLLEQPDIPRKFHKAQVLPSVVPPTTTKEDKARLAQEEADLYLSTTIDYTPTPIPPSKPKSASSLALPAAVKTPTTQSMGPVMDADDDLEDLLRQQPASDIIEDSNVDIDELLNTIE